MPGREASIQEIPSCNIESQPANLADLVHARRLGKLGVVNLLEPSGRAVDADGLTLEVSFERKEISLGHDA